MYTGECWGVTCGRLAFWSRCRGQKYSWLFNAKEIIHKQHKHLMSHWLGTDLTSFYYLLGSFLLKFDAIKVLFTENKISLRTHTTAKYHACNRCRFLLLKQLMSDTKQGKKPTDWQKVEGKVYLFFFLPFGCFNPINVKTIKQTCENFMSKGGHVFEIKIQREYIVRPPRNYDP